MANVAEKVAHVVVGEASNGSSETSGADASETVDGFARISPRGFRAAVGCLPHNDVRHLLSNIRHPSLVIVGELDEETPVSYAETLSDGLWDGELVVLDGVGHLSPAEDPERFNQLVRRFL